MKIEEAINRFSSIRNELLSASEQEVLSTIGTINLLDCTLAALEKVQEYLNVGTVEECQIATEKQKAKKPIPIDYKKYIGVVDNAGTLRGLCWCPNCHQTVASGSFCKNCGQKLDWDDECPK